MHKPALTFARFLSVTENRAALLAVRDVLECVRQQQPRRCHNPLFLHGPTGSGKTHLISALIGELTLACSDLTVHLLHANDLAANVSPEEVNEGSDALRAADVLVVEDVQHLRTAEPLVQLLDDSTKRQRQVVLTALTGPAQLTHRGEAYPQRLTSRLAAGLVVALQPWSAASRLLLLQAQLTERRLKVPDPVVDWLAEHLSGGVRQLEGALTQLEALRQAGLPLALATVAEHFREQAQATQVTLERIAQQVSGYFQVKPQQLQSRQRSRQILLSRQIGMYLARQLTGLSLEQIGNYFGGRDHSTVLHACHKIEQALLADAALHGAVRHLQANLV